MTRTVLLARGVSGYDKISCCWWAGVYQVRRCRAYSVGLRDSGVGFDAYGRFKLLQGPLGSLPAANATTR